MPEPDVLTFLDVDDLLEHPGNYRNGDVPAIRASIADLGFFAPITVQKSSGRVIAGNHRLVAARAEGLGAVPALIKDCSDEEALRIMVADNRTTDVASYELEALRASLAEGFEGTGYDDPGDIDTLYDSVAAGALTDADVPPELEPFDPGVASGRAPAAVGGIKEVILVFDADDFAEFSSLVAIAKERFGVPTTSQAVLAALRVA